MIEKFHDPDAIKWRIEYLNKNIVKTPHNETEHTRLISQEESEIISSNPHMFRCSIGINAQYLLHEQSLELFDFGIKLCEIQNTPE